MYFVNRTEAGQQIAARLVDQYRYENTVVVALNDGAVLVAAQVASALHCVLTMLISKPLYLPGEPKSIGSVDQDGTFIASSDYSESEVDEYNSEFRGHVEQQKMEAFHSVNQLLGSGGVISKDILRYHNIILVTDGLTQPTQLDVARAYIKTISTLKLVIATPLATVNTVDAMHLMADQICCLSVIDSELGVDHYYQDNTLPTHEKIVRIIQDIVLQWS